MVATDKESPSQPHLNPGESHDRKVRSDFVSSLGIYCGDATSTQTFMNGLGLDLTAKSDQSTGNKAHASYLVEFNNIKMIFTAPYRQASADESNQGHTIFYSRARM